jgi:hypothetical protein
MKLKFTLREVLLLMTVVALGIMVFSHQFGAGSHAHRLPCSSSKDKLFLRVLAADDFSPVPDVHVSLTWVGKGCDGGVHGQATTDQNGVAYVPTGFIPGPIQVYLTPPKGGRFRYTSFTKHHTMLTARPDGTYYPSLFRIEIDQTDDPDFQPH